MATKMLIDASHPEETRVAVVDDERLEEFDFETSTKTQNKGNIYLARVSRVEPSLQAAFVDYGADRQGFLAFNEIHPDYFQIPIGDRKISSANSGDAASGQDDDAGGVDFQEELLDEGPNPGKSDEISDSKNGATDNQSEQVKRRERSYRSYRIQEVIKRRQVILIQVNKEERGTKGAAVTTYISLPGRYCVLMPNTLKGGGVSRKIESADDRRRLRSIVSELDVPKGMAVIVRTAGQERNRSEIKRDFDYLLRLWEIVRKSTLQSVAPELIYEEANLIKRSIRDLYRSDFESILVQGDEGYRIAKKFMRTMMPSRAKLVQPYKDRTTLFREYKIEEQLDQMHEPVVGLPSGGYLVINLTEALVAVDVNSGSATRERSIEETALNTNLEAADAIARQVKLRDLAGLVVVDFIDMAEARNNRAVEKRLREAVSVDRARVQMGRISVFGLLEFSRQRLRPSLLEVNSVTCLQCGGSGRTRSTESLVMQALRELEQEGLKGNKDTVEAALPRAAAMYLLNSKRQTLFELEKEYEMKVIVVEQRSQDPANVLISPVVEGNQVSKRGKQPSSGEKDEKTTPSKRQPSKRGRPKGKPQVTGVSAAKPTSSVSTAGTEDLSGLDEEGSSARSRPRRRGRRGGRRRSPAERTDQAQPKAEIENSRIDESGNNPDVGKEVLPRSAVRGGSQAAPRSGNASETERDDLVASSEIKGDLIDGGEDKAASKDIGVATSRSGPRKRRRTGTRRRVSGKVSEEEKPISNSNAGQQGDKEGSSTGGRRRKASSPSRRTRSPSNKIKGPSQVGDQADTTSGAVKTSSTKAISKRDRRSTGSSSSETDNHSLEKQGENLTTVAAMGIPQTEDKRDGLAKRSRRKGWWQRVTGSN